MSVRTNGVSRRRLPGSRGPRELALTVPILIGLTGCGSPSRDDDVPEVSVGVVAPADDSSMVVMRDLWMGLADEPIHHMRHARELYDAGDRPGAARDLEKAASLFRWGRRYSFGATENAAFLTAARELEEVARLLRSGAREPDPALHGVLAKGYQVIAGHHLGLAREQWDAGRHQMAARLLNAAVDELEKGFELSEEPAGASIEADFVAARGIADRLGTDEPPSEADVRGVLSGLRRAVKGLDEVLGSRRR